MTHESRTDWSMLLGSLFLLIVGAGPRSLDARLRSNVADENG
jgi:putative oxidoreductase